LHIKIGVLASGRGSNFQSIINAIENKEIDAEIVLLITDNPEAYAIKRAINHGIEFIVMIPDNYPSKDLYFKEIANEFRKRKVDLVVLAGFMRIVKKPLIEAFPMKIMNIHPALLPSFPGLHSQKQAIEYGVKISGCTVHFVDEGMDTGPIIIQAAVPVFHDDTDETLSERILKMEHKIFPEAIKLYSENRLEVEGRIVKIKEKGNIGKDDILINPKL
jgi:phosphoribosylglycinamide formyltransferase-1